jgi:cold shock protein
MFKGKIKKVIRDKGYGFIQAEDSREIFFHMSVLRGLDFQNLKEGDPVEFDVEKDRLSGKPRAINVKASH